MTFIDTATWTGGEGTGESIAIIGPSIRKSPVKKTEPRKEQKPGEFTGKIAAPIRQRGFGFITPDNGGSDVLFHIRDNPAAETLNRGTRVTYDIKQDIRRGRTLAVNVRPV